MKLIDTFTLSELHNFGFKARGTRPITEAREYFPERPKDYVKTFRNLTHYATNRWCALDGEPETYGKIAERIYSELPEYAKKIVR